MNERELINSYVLLDTEIKALTKQRDAIKEQCIALGEGAHRGDVGQVSVSLSQRSTLDKDKVAAVLSPEVFESCYTSSTCITVRVTAYNKEL